MFFVTLIGLQSDVSSTEEAGKLLPGTFSSYSQSQCPIRGNSQRTKVFDFKPRKYLLFSEFLLQFPFSDPVQLPRMQISATDFIPASSFHHFLINSSDRK